MITTMNKPFLLCICLIVLAGSLFGQAPSDTPIASPTITAAVPAANGPSPIAPPAVTSTTTPPPTATASSASSDLADKIHKKLEKKLGRKHGIIIDADNKDSDHIVAGDGMPSEVIPLVGIVFLSIFGAPVLI